MAQGFLGLVPAHWWVRLGSGSSGGQSQVLRQLCALGVLKQQTCWWVELYLCSTSRLVWGVPALEPKGWWVGLCSSANELEEGFQTGTCQHQCPRGGTGSPKCLLPVSVLSVNSSCLLILQNAHQDRQMGLT